MVHVFPTNRDVVDAGVHEYYGKRVRWIMTDKDKTSLPLMAQSDLENLFRKVSDEVARREGQPFPNLKPHRPCQAKSFLVPERIRHLTPQELDALEAGFRAWCDESRTMSHRQSRTRMLCLFLLLRYTGMKLGEALVLHERLDIDTERAVVRVQKTEESDEREVPIPESLAKEFARLFDAPMFAGVQSKVFAIDQGFVRKKMYEVAARCGIPEQHVNAQVIRTSRAIELMRQGLPLPVVQKVLGHKDVTLTGQYILFSQENAQQLLDYAIKRQGRARQNVQTIFFGSVISAVAEGESTHVTLLTQSGLKVRASLPVEPAGRLGVAVGVAATAFVDATAVTLVSCTQGACSTGNAFAGHVQLIREHGQELEVSVSLQDGTILKALAPLQAASECGLQDGGAVLAVFSRSAVSLFTQ